MRQHTSERIHTPPEYMNKTDQISIPLPPADRPEVVAAFYRFVPLEDVAGLRAELQQVCNRAHICGTILLAREGINGTVSGPRRSIETLFAKFDAHGGLAAMEAKFSFASGPAFHRMKVRIKKEIVTMGEPDVDPRGCVGTYVKPEDWNALIEDPGTLVIDTRNDYEVAIGKFANAVNPHTASFREFPEWVKHNLDNLPESDKPKRIAMYCTGGIRCEKATSFLAARGYDNVFHLDGGILKYLEEIPQPQSRWQGECFVFDQRVSVSHGLQPGAYGMCRGCRMPLSAEEMRSPLYEEGVCCPKCHNNLTPEQAERFRERQRQMELAEQRGKRHIGMTQDQTKK